MPEGANPPAKPEGYGEQAKEELGRLLHEASLSIKPPTAKRDTFLAHVGAKIAAEHNVLDLYNQRIFEAVWKYDENIADPEVLAGIAKEVGLTPETFLAGLQEDRYRDQVYADHKLADGLHIWTIPSYVGDHGTIQVHHFKDIPSLEDILHLF
jgi:predicted DsbA family dithiol-disulfide isomerase